MVKMGEKIMNKEEICEEWCFHCKDGGSMRICDYGDCLKAYHPKCVGEDDSFLDSEVPWTCRWHFCFSCNNRRPKFRCFCCPKAICERCIRKYEFPIMAQKQGLCHQCFTLATIIEGVKNPDSDQGELDFNDRNTCETLFKEYWEIVKEKEGLSSIHVRRSFELLKLDKNFEDLSGSEDSSQDEDEYQPTSSNDNSNERKRHRRLNESKRNGGNTSAMRRKLNSKKKEFNGWASNLLFDFLHSIGKDTTQELSEHDVSAIVIEYCHENKLFDPEKKKKVVCDERLKSLLGKGRNYVWKNSIPNLLAPHFAENVEQSDDEHEQSEDDHETVVEDKSESAPISSKRQRNSNSNVKPQKNEAIDLVVLRRSCFASVVPENIKRLYLNRSLIEELSEKPETFEAKVVGSFVRIKPDPYDYTQKNSHMLVKITGIKNRTSTKDEVTKDVLLQVSGMAKDISISHLSDDNFSEEECEDLRQRVKDGRLERLSIVKFEEKARSLHDVITKQWIVKELCRLDKHIELANQKGWRRELHAYYESKQLLMTASEQSRLLDEFPEVIADEPEIELTEKQYFGKDLFPEPDSRDLSKPSTKDSGGDCVFPCVNDVTDFAEHEQQCQTLESAELEQCHSVSSDLSSDDDDVHEPVVNKHIILEVEKNDPEASHSELVSVNPIACIEICDDEQDRLKKRQNVPGSELIEICDNEKENTIQVKREIIELSDDEEQDDISRASKKIADDPKSCSWFCMNPRDDKTAGPYPMSLLKEWNDAFPNMTWKVWNTNQNPKEAISLPDAVRQFSHGK